MSDDRYDYERDGDKVRNATIDIINGIRAYRSTMGEKRFYLRREERRGTSAIGIVEKRRGDTQWRFTQEVNVVGLSGDELIAIGRFVKEATE